jgi:hypothetical protein
MRAAAALGDAAAVEHALKVVEGFPGGVTAATRAEGHAVLAALAGRPQEALQGFLDAARRWAEVGLEFEAAMSRLTFVRLLGVADPQARAAADEARATFERLGARPLLDRLAAAVEAPAATVAVPSGG